MSRTIQRHSSPVSAAHAVVIDAPNPFGAPGDPPRSFWQSPTVQNVLPFVTSLSMHAAIICVGLLTYKAITIVAAPPTEIEKTIPYSPIIPDAPLPGLGVKFPGVAHDIHDPAQQEFPTPLLHGRSTAPGATPLDVDAGGKSDPGPHEFAIGPGPRRGVGGNRDGLNGTGGTLADFGVPGSGMRGIQGIGHSMFPPVALRRVVYVCDASGSMIPKLEPLKVELTKAIMGLKAIQEFDVIFFRAEPVPQSFASSLVFAAPEDKARAVKFLDDVTASGDTNPLPGIEEAFRQKPQMIMLLTDGDFPDNDAVLAKIRLLNKEHKVRINTIAFVGQADTDVKFKELLKTIAKENGGSYKLVTPDDL